MNKDFFQKNEDNFKQICDMCDKTFTHNELIAMLNSESIPAKQIAALKFESIESNTDAEVLLNNLIGCDGKIREAVAYTINKLIKSDSKIADIFSEQSAEIFAKASIDINANICRYVIESLPHLIVNKSFAILYASYIVKYAEEALYELSKFIYKDKKYTVNKQLFKLYWCLEAIKYLTETVCTETLMNILSRCLIVNEYTIREKIAEIVSVNNNFNNIKETLADDSNYYVRQALNHHCTL